MSHASGFGIGRVDRKIISAHQPQWLCLPLEVQGRLFPTVFYYVPMLRCDFIRSLTALQPHSRQETSTMQDLVSNSPEITMLLTLTFFILFEVWRQNMHAAGLQVEDVINAVIIILMWTFAKAAVQTIMEERQNAVRNTVYRIQLLVQICGFAKKTTTLTKGISRGSPTKPSSTSWDLTFLRGKISRFLASNVENTNKPNHSISAAKTNDGVPMAFLKASGLDAGPGAVAHSLPQRTASHMDDRKVTSVPTGSSSGNASFHATDLIPCQTNLVSTALHRFHMILIRY